VGAPYADVIEGVIVPTWRHEQAQRDDSTNSDPVGAIRHSFEYTYDVETALMDAAPYEDMDYCWDLTPNSVCLKEAARQALKRTSGNGLLAGKAPEAMQPNRSSLSLPPTAFWRTRVSPVGRPTLYATTLHEQVPDRSPDRR